MAEAHENPTSNARRERAQLLRQLVKDRAVVKELDIPEGTTTRKAKVLFFKVDLEKLPHDLINAMLKGVDKLALYNFYSSNIYNELDDAQEDLQLARHSPNVLHKKITREENPHHLWLAVDVTDVMRVLGCVVIDPEIVEFQLLEGGVVKGVEEKSLFVMPHAQGLGIADQLMTLAQEFVYRKLHQDLISLVPPSDIALAFCRNAGYELKGKTKVEVEVEGLEPLEFLFYVLALTMAQMAERYGSGT